MGARRLPYLPAVDGLRAIAVAAVVAFHLSPGAVPGGFLGVDTFFVVSGYLITSLLLNEHAADGGIGLRTFWSRRARRLLPALLVVLSVVAIAAAAWSPAESLGAFRRDALAGLGYVANWRFIASGTSYFDLTTGPSPLRHLWSLAIEEQFYVVWPLVTLAALRRSVRTLGVVAVVGAVASVVAMVVAGAGDRAYFGTDTRAFALLIGAALAVTLRSSRVAAPRWLGPAGGIALAACGAAWWVAGEHSEWLFQWGFPAYALLTAVTIAAVVRSASGPLARLLSVRPLVAVGKVSYGLYLWHWPAIVFLTKQRTGFDGVALGAYRLGVAVAATIASYFLIERPVRFGSALRGRRTWVATPGAFAGTAVIVVVASAGAVAVPDYLRTPGDGGSIVAAVSVNAPVTVDVTTTTAAPHEARHPTSVLLVGDSVAWTFHEELAFILGARGVPFASAAVVGCGAAVGVEPDLGVVAVDDQPVTWASACEGAVPQAQQQGLDAVHPDLVLFHSSWETSDRFVHGGRILRFGTPEWRANVLEELRRSVDRLSTGGAVVAFVTVPPPVDGEVESSMAVVARRQRAFDDVIDQLAEEDPARVAVIDLASIVCDGAVDACPTVVDGIRLRPLDGIHYDDAGATWVAERITDAALALDLNRAR